MWGWLLSLVAVAVVSRVSCAGAGAARLICYVENGRTDRFSECTHLVYAGDATGEKLEGVLKDYRKNNPTLKIVLRVTEIDENVKSLLKTKYVQGLEIHDAHRSLNKSAVQETVEAARSTISSSGGGPLFLAIPANPELLAKYYDLRSLMKKVDLMMVQTHGLGVVKKMTYHPSRLSGVWDMMNTDSVVDLVVGLGVPASKVVISLPATANQFTLVNETLSTPGSPAEEDQPKEIDQGELCRLLQKGRWTLERDQDLSAPYAFKDKTWISFEDGSSVDVKGKYARVRGLAGLALHKADRDVETPCGVTLRTALAKVLNQQSRAPRAAVLRSLEHDILAAPSNALEALQVSPYRITQVVDSDGVIHSIREDTRTEFSCTRQGYFVHPRTCARFYRCVKFDQLSPDFTVFEFDCPTGLAFDSRYEVCVWPGSLPDSQACPGSSEIAPVPHSRFICPEHEGYYADPENCRWFFACLDHGKSPLTAYEFRCPFGLGFDAAQLKCDWPWLVPACGNIGRYEAEAHGFSAAILTGSSGFRGQTADAVNVAAHQSLVSGAALNNLVGIQGGHLRADNALDANFIASQEFANQARGQGIGASNGHIGLVQPAQYVDDSGKYTTGTLILDTYRPSTKAQPLGQGYSSNADTTRFAQGFNSYSNLASTRGQKGLQFETTVSDADSTGTYVHDPSGDYAEVYVHEDTPAVGYVHEDDKYKQSTNAYNYGKYTASASGQYDGSSTYNSQQYSQGSTALSGQYNDYSSGSNGDYSKSYLNNNADQYVAGIYRAGGHLGGAYDTLANGANQVNVNQYHGSYSSDNQGNYLSGSNVHAGSPHTLTAGAVNVGLVGKTTLVDASYNNQNNYQTVGLSSGTQFHAYQYSNGANLHTASGLNTIQPISHISQSGVSINHAGTDSHNLDGYEYVTTPTASVIPTTATPYAVTMATPTVTYKTTYVPEPPKSSVSQIFGYTKPAITYVQPKIVQVPHVTPKVTVTDYNQGINHQYQNQEQSVSTIGTGSTFKTEFGYDYTKPTVQFQDGVSHTTPAPAISVSTYKPQGFSHSQQTLHNDETVGYDYTKPTIQFQDGVSHTAQAPAISVSTYKPQGFSHSQQTLHNIESVGIQYSTPTPVPEEPFKKLVAYTTGPSTTSYVQTAEPSYTAQGFSHQTSHSESNANTYSESNGAIGYQYTKPVDDFNIGVQYSTPQPAITVQPVVQGFSHQTFQQPQVYSQQTLHTVDANRVNSYSSQDSSSGYDYQKPTIKFESAQPQHVTEKTVVTSTYKPQTFSQQTIHKVETPYVSVSTPLPQVQYTYQQPAVSVYQNPILSYSQKVTPVAYTSQTQKLHKVQLSYQQPQVSIYENPILKYKQEITPVKYVEPATVYTQSYQPIVQHQVISQTNQHETSQQQNAELNQHAYYYNQPEIQRDVETIKSVSYKAPAVSTVAPGLSYSNTYSGASYASNEYLPPSSTVKPTPYSGPEYLTPTEKVEPNVVNYGYKSDYQNNFSHQQNSVKNNYHESSVNSQSDEGKNVVFLSTTPSTLAYENHYSETSKNAPVSQVSFSTSHVQPKIVESYHVSSYPGQKITTNYNQIPIQSPEVQVEYKSEKYVPPAVSSLAPELSYSKTYSAASNILPAQPNYAVNEYLTPLSTVIPTPYSGPEYLTPTETLEDNVVNYGYKSDYQNNFSHQENSVKTNYQQSTINAQSQEGKDVVFVSTTPSSLAYENHYSDYESSKNASVSQVSFSTSHVQPKIVESYHVSSYPGKKITTNYNQIPIQSPEVQVEYKSEEYAPIAVSTVAPELSYRKSYSGDQTKYSANEYLPPSSTTKPTSYSGPEYLTPTEKSESNVAHYDYKTGYHNNFSHQENSLKTSLLGFGTVGPDAGLVSPVSYTTSAPIDISSVSYSLTPQVVTSTYAPVEQGLFEVTPSLIPERRTRPKVRPIAKTTFKSQEYLPPVSTQSVQYNPYNDNTVVVSSTSAPSHRNIVVETSKSSLLGFGSTGNDAESVSYSLVPKVITSTYAPVEQGLFEVTPSSIPEQRTRSKGRPITKTTTLVPTFVESTTFKGNEYLPPSVSTQGLEYKSYDDNNVVVPYSSAPNHRNIVVETSKSNLLGFGTIGNDAGLVTYKTLKPVSSTETYSSSYASTQQDLVEETRPKVAVVTKINDFNPLLVKKLGAVCSCQSPTVVLKGTRPTTQQSYDYSSNDGERGRGDIGNAAIRYSSTKSLDFTTASPVVSSSFNPIIVPEDSFYDDSIEITPKTYVSSTPAIISSTTKSTRRSRVKNIQSTAAPTYRTVLLNDVSPTIVVKDSGTAAGASPIDSRFDRYGPGGLRSRDETLQGSVDCQRAGLFRHPKQCNKFYACRWDCTKQRFTLHVFNCPVQLSFDASIGACNWPSQGPACQSDTLLTNVV